MFLPIINHAQGCLQNESIPIVTNIQELINSNSKTVLFRTHDIHFQFAYRHLDTTNYLTLAILDSIANYLISNDNVVNVDIYIHLSLLEWDEAYSHSLLLYMYEDIISYLGRNGVDTICLNGRQCYNYYPIINCNEMSNEEKRNCLINDDFRMNRRVEFLIKKS